MKSGRALRPRVSMKYTGTFTRREASTSSFISLKSGS